MIKHMWMLDILNGVYVCWPHVPTNPNSCTGCGLELEDTDVMPIIADYVPDADTAEKLSPKLLANLLNRAAEVKHERG